MSKQTIELDAKQVTEALTEYAGKLLHAPVGTEFIGKVVIYPHNKTAKVEFRPPTTGEESKKGEA